VQAERRDVVAQGLERQAGVPRGEAELLGGEEALDRLACVPPDERMRAQALS